MNASAIAQGNSQSVSGGFELEVELEADGVPDRFFACSVLFRKRRNRVTGLELLRRDGGRNAAACNHWRTEGHAWIDDYATRLLDEEVYAVAGELLLE